MIMSLFAKWIFNFIILLVFIFVNSFSKNYNEYNLGEIASMNNVQEMEKYHN